MTPDAAGAADPPELAAAADDLVERVLEFCAELRRSVDHRPLLAAFLLEDAATDCRRVASELRAAQALLGTTEQAPVPASPQYRKSTQYQPPERHRP